MKSWRNFTRNYNGAFDCPVVDGPLTGVSQYFTGGQKQVQLPEHVLYGADLSDKGERLGPQ